MTYTSGYAIGNFEGSPIIVDVVFADDGSIHSFGEVGDLTGRIEERVKEFVDGLSRESCLALFEVSKETDEWIDEIEDPFGIDLAEDLDDLPDGERKWYQEVVTTGVCHTFFKKVFNELAGQKYGLAV